MSLGSVAAALGRRRLDAIRPRWDHLLTLYGLASSAERIVEFGTGCSTVAMAVALRERGQGKLTTVDARPEWLADVDACLPDDAKPFVDLRHAELQTAEHDGKPCHRYADVPAGPFDLVFIDGPDPKDVPGWHGAATAADPLYLDLAPEAKVVFAGRGHNLAFYTAHLGRAVEVAREPGLSIVTFKGA